MDDDDDDGGVDDWNMWSMHIKKIQYFRHCRVNEKLVPVKRFNGVWCLVGKPFSFCAIFLVLFHFPVQPHIYPILSLPIFSAVSFNSLSHLICNSSITSTCVFHAVVKENLVSTHSSCNSL